MNIKLCALAGCSALLVGAGTPTHSCKVQATGPAGHWKFVQVHDLRSGEVVLRQAIKSGDWKPVEATGDKIRIDWKLGGYKHYRTGPTATCTGGNIIKI